MGGSIRRTARGRGWRPGPAVAVLTLAALLGTAPAAGHTPTSFCNLAWGSLEKSSPGMTSVPVIGARVGRHPCFDRLVIDLGGKPAPGFDVRYANPIRSPGSGKPFIEADDATLAVTILAPGYNVTHGGPTVSWSAGTRIPQADELAAGGFRTFRDLVYGGSFEGRSVIALDVRARLPFRAFALDGPDARSRLVIDVAHRW